MIGSQLQSSALPDRLRVGEAVRLFGGRRRRRRCWTSSGWPSRRRSAFASLSGGERQRLFLVLALVNRPRLVILDELTQGLDPAARRSVWAAVDQLRDDGTSVLLVTHELDEAERLCDRVVAMRAGRVLDAGSPAELVDRHGRPCDDPLHLPPEPIQAAQLAARFAALPGVTESAPAPAAAPAARPSTATGAPSRTSAPRWCRPAGCRPTCRCGCPTSRTPCSACSTRPARTDDARPLDDIADLRPDRSTAMSTAAGRLVRTELRLMTRDPLTADLRVRLPGRDHADHRRLVRHRRRPSRSTGQPVALVRRVVPDRRDRARPA